MSLAQQFIPLEAANENLVSAVLTGSTKHNIRDFKARDAISGIISAVDQKIMFDDHISGISGYDDLAVVKLSADEYAQMLEDGTCLSNAIYIVEAPTLNAFKQRIINVAPGTGLSDAVNLQQLQSVSAGLTGDYYKKTETSSSTQIANALTSYYTKSQTSSSTQIANALTGYYTKSQTSSATQISTALTSYYPKTETSSSTQIANALTAFYPKTETSSASQLTTKFATKLEANDVNMRYDTTARKIVLSAKTNVTSVDCTDFIKDGMLSTAELCGTTLVLKFNTDAGSAPISVEMSSFVDNYDGKISSLSDAIDQKIMFDDHISETSGYNDLSVVKLSADEYAQMLEDGTCLSNAIYIVEAPTLNAFKQRIINVAPGTGLSDAVNLEQLQSVSAGLTSDYYKKTETSSSTQIANALTSYYTKSQTSSASQISTALTGYYKKTETSSASQISTAINAISTYAGDCLPLSGGTMSGSISCGDAIGIDFNGVQVTNGEQGDGFAVYVGGTAKYAFYDTDDGDPPTAMPPQGNTDVNIMRGMDVYAVLGDISTLIHAI